MGYKERYDSWLGSDSIDEETKNELRGLQDEKEIEDRFYTELEFGTAGMRGIIGAGTNRMNRYTVTKATQGLANYIKAQRVSMPQVAISYDSRHMSKEFAHYVSLCLNANGIKTYISDEIRPVPVLSFMVRYYNCIAGVMITASHNPKEYNGYKVYWSDGGQITEPIDLRIMEEVNAINDYSTIRMLSEEEAREKGLYNTVGKEVDDEYIQQIKKESLYPKICETFGGEINIVYTPLNGAGNKMVRRILDEMGFANVHVVPEEEAPDPNFTTVPNPNPEYVEVYKLGVELAKKVEADVVIATDPDADRLGMMVRDAGGEYHLFTGNMIGSILTEYILSELKNVEKYKGNEIIVKSIVSTNLVNDITREHGATLVNVLTGFKYIGEEINRCENERDYSFAFGFEESYGYLKGTHVRDKDAVVISMLVAELMAFCKSKGITVFEYMENIYKKYGYYEDLVKSFVYSGKEGADKIKSLMKAYRENVRKEIAGIGVTEFIDYENDTKTNLLLKTVCSTGLPRSNVLYYTLSDGSFICVRPSGTEPKIKYYFSIKGENKMEAKEKLEKIFKDFCKE